jgi:hypothetical protein
VTASASSYQQQQLPFCPFILEPSTIEAPTTLNRQGSDRFGSSSFVSSLFLLGVVFCKNTNVVILTD